MSGVLRASTLVGRKVEKAKGSEPPKAPGPVQTCPNNNWIDLYYNYPSDRPVSLADYLILDESGNKVASGKLDQNGFCHVSGLPDYLSTCTIIYTSDPKDFEIFNDRKPIVNPYYQAGKEQQNPAEPMNPLLAQAIVIGTKAVMLMVPYSQYRYEVMSAAGEWSWGAVQGDWNDDQTLGQIVFDSALSLIPVVDQVADVRDVCANLYQLTVKRRYDEFGPWFGLVMTVIGMFPEIGTAIKGAVKSVIKIGKEASTAIVKKGVKFAEHLLEKNGVNIGELIRIMNYFGEGNVIRWLRKQINDFAKFKKFVSEKIKEILLKFKEKLIALKGKLIEKLEQMLESIVESIEKCLQRYEEFVFGILDRGKKELDDITKQAEDYSIKGVTQAPNGAKQLVQPPPLAPALERQKKLLSDLEAKAARAGMEPAELKGLVKNSKENGRRTVVRFTNEHALKWHGKEGFLPKPIDVKLKTAKEGDLAGLVVRPKGDPSQWEEWERANVRYLESKGYDWDGAGRLIDPHGNRFYGDYDLQSVQRQVMDGNGKKITVEEIADENAIESINKDMGQSGRFKGQDKPVQHGPENEFWVKTDEQGNIITDPKYGKTVPATEEEIRSGKAVLGRQHGADEKYLVVNPDGSVEVLESPEELYNMYRKEDDELPWNYHNKPATGKQVELEQAERKANKEKYERGAVAEAKAEETQMKWFIDDIIGDGTHFVEKPSNYVELVPTPF